MACVVDWGTVWTAVGALATIFTGAAAAVIARQAFLFGKRSAAQDKRAAKRRRRAYVIAAHVEIQSIRRRCQVAGAFVGKAMRTGEAQDLVGSAKMIAMLPSFDTSAWLLESPTVGDLPKATGVQVAQTAAFAAEGERFRALIAGFLRAASGDDASLADALPGIYAGIASGMDDLIRSARESERLLSELSGLPATQDESIATAVQRAVG